MAVYQIGTYQFVSMTGQIPTVQTRIERITRPGVNYAAYRRIGYGSEPFQLETRVNCASILDGRNLLLGYGALVAAGAQALIFADHNVLVAEVLGCHVLRVEPVRLGSVNQWCGSLNDTHTFELAARWQLELKA